MSSTRRSLLIQPPLPLSHKPVKTKKLIYMLGIQHHWQQKDDLLQSDWTFLCSILYNTIGMCYCRELSPKSQITWHSAKLWHHSVDFSDVEFGSVLSASLIWYSAAQRQESHSLDSSHSESCWTVPALSGRKNPEVWEAEVWHETVFLFTSILLRINGAVLKTKASLLERWWTDSNLKSLSGTCHKRVKEFTSKSIWQFYFTQYFGLCKLSAVVLSDLRIR